MQERKIINIDYKDEFSYKYMVYKPKDMKPKLPLVIFLHGAGERGEDIELVKTHGMPKIFEGDVEYGCILISPQCPENSFWVAEIEKLKLFIDKIIETYDVDKSRVYLTGISMGGYGTWFLAERYPEMFAAVMPVCGGGMPWLASALDMPVWAVHGEIDDVVELSESEKMISAIKKSRGMSNLADTKFTVVQGVAHNAWDYAYTDETINWMLSQSR